MHAAAYFRATKGRCFHALKLDGLGRGRRAALGPMRCDAAWAALRHIRRQVHVELLRIDEDTSEVRCLVTMDKITLMTTQNKQNKVPGTTVATALRRRQW